jgi:hypothetical protein
VQAYLLILRYDREWARPKDHGRHPKGCETSEKEEEEIKRTKAGKEKRKGEKEAEKEEEEEGRIKSGRYCSR